MSTCWRTGEKTRPVWHSGKLGKADFSASRGNCFAKNWDTILIINTWQLCVQHVDDTECTCPHLAAENGGVKELDGEQNNST